MFTWLCERYRKPFIQLVQRHAIAGGKYRKAQKLTEHITKAYSNLSTKKYTYIHEEKCKSICDSEENVVAIKCFVSTYRQP